jgi:hypothetical protein
LLFALPPHSFLFLEFTDCLPPPLLCLVLLVFFKQCLLCVSELWMCEMVTDFTRHQLLPPHASGLLLFLFLDE